MVTATHPKRFRALMRSAGRDVTTTRATLALFAAASRAQDRLEAALAASGSELSPAKFNVLIELAARPDGRLPLCRLAGRLIRSAPNVSGLVDRMESAGLVRRVRDEVDRRVVFAEITERGWEALAPAAGLRGRNIL